MDEAFHLISFFENPTEVSSTAANVHPCGGMCGPIFPQLYPPPPPPLDKRGHSTSPPPPCPRGQKEQKSFCYDSFIVFFQFFVHVDIKRPPPPLGGQAWTFC